MRAVDTNLLVRLIARDDAAQLDAAEAFVARGAWVSHLVLVETSWVLDSVYALAPKQIGTAIEMLLNHRDLVIERADVAAAALAQFKRRPRLGFSDCMVVEAARSAGHLPLGTFDRSLARIDGTQRVGS